MISITELWCGQTDRNHSLRYAKPASNDDIKPVVVWNSTRRCNLKCVHCYTSSQNVIYNDELDTQEAEKLIFDLSEMKVPCLIISGGEPFMRKDLFHLLGYAGKKSLPVAISTNGTLIDIDTARELKNYNIRYVGISLDGIGDTHDRFRGIAGAFKKTNSAFTYLREFKVPMGLRFTLTKETIPSLSDIFTYVKNEEIKRVCFYHYVPTGRGKDAKSLAPSHEETRSAIDQIIEFAESCHPDPERVKRVEGEGSSVEILTVDNFADNIYLYQKKLERDPKDAPRLLQLIKDNGGAFKSSGVGIACVDETGNVHPDQFWRDAVLGNIHDRKFSEIWFDKENDLLQKLRNERTTLVKGKCAKCKWQGVCGGGLRSRAYGYTGDAWAEDEGCYINPSPL